MAPPWVKAAGAQHGPEVQVGVMLVQGSALGRDEVALKQHIPKPSLTPRVERMCGGKHPQDPAIQQHRGERIWGRG